MRNTTKKAVSLGLAATLLAMMGAAMAVAPVLASTSVTSAGSVQPGTTSAGTATFTFTENAMDAFPTSTNSSLIVTIADSLSAGTVHFTGTPVLSAPGSLGATVAVDSGGHSFTIRTTDADDNNVEPITVSGLHIAADAGAAAGDIKAVMSGSLVDAIISPTATATGTLQTLVATDLTGGVIVNVSSPCAFAITGGLNSNVTFSGLDSRGVVSASGLAGVQQTLTIDAGSASHAIGSTISQTVADCLGANLASPGTVGTASSLHLAFTTQPGGGATAAVWAQQPVVAIENSSNTIITGDNSTVVTLAIGTNPAGGTLTCTSGLSRTVVGGIATFAGCSINAGSTTAYTLVATSVPVATSATSNGFLVGSTQHLAFTTQPGGGAAGVAWAQQPVVAVQNASNQTITGDISTVVTLAIGTNPAAGTLTCTSGLSRTVVAGVATFFGCSINNASASAYTLTATSVPLATAATSNAFLIGGAVPVTLTDAIAPGVNRGTSGFGTASVIVKPNAYATVLGTTSPNLAGSLVQVWTRTKTGAWHLLTSRLVASDGTVHYFGRINAWTAYQLKFAGDAGHAAAASHGRIATIRALIVVD